MNENYEDSWEYLDPISNEEIASQVYKGRAVPQFEGMNDD